MISAKGTPEYLKKFGIASLTLAVILALLPLSFLLFSLVPRRALGLLGVATAVSGILDSSGKLLAFIGINQAVSADPSLQRAKVEIFEVLLPAFIGFLPVFVVYVELFLYSVWLALSTTRSFFSVAGSFSFGRFGRARLLKMFGLPIFLSSLGRNTWKPILVYATFAIINVHLFAIFLFPDTYFRQYFYPSPLSQIIFTATTCFVTLAVISHLLGIRKALEEVGAKYTARAYQNVRAWDGRRPILFLRQFQQDQVPIRVRTLNQLLIWPAGLARKKTVDEVLISGAASLGPLIAIGDPRSPIPLLGAARIHLPATNANWQSLVSKLIEEARVIFICPSETAGVQWEIAEIQRLNASKKTVFLANPRWSSTQNAMFFGTKFPELIRLEDWKRIVAVSVLADNAFEVLVSRRYDSHSLSVAVNRIVEYQLSSNGTKRRPDKELSM